MKRRNFIKLCSTLPLLGFSPQLLARVSHKQHLILIELKGGNDALNTLIPIEDDAYYQLRPKIAIAKSQALNLSNGFGLHPALKPLLPLWQQGDMSWIQGLGYPTPNRSHFRSIEIWDTASDANQYLSSGWLAQLYQQSQNGIEGIIVDKDSGPLYGEGLNVVQIQDKKSFINLTKQLKAVQNHHSTSALAHILNVQNNVRQNSQLIIENLKKAKNSNVAFPKSRFARDLELVSQMILNDVHAPVYKIGLGSFDTHKGQAGRHKNLLTQFAQGLEAFSRSMKQAGIWDNVLIMTYSEFGRRANENASQGTDHGTAAAHLLLGGRVNGGLHGRTPSFKKLVNKDLQYTTDFRQLYHTVAVDWLKQPSLWQSHKKLPLIEF